MVKTVYYVGFYGVDKEDSGRNVYKNPAATVKMDFVISCLKQLGYKVVVVSVTYDLDCGAKRLKHVRIDDLEEYIYIPYCYFRIKGRVVGFRFTSMLMLKRYLMKNLKRDSIIITYHALLYKDLYSKLHKRKKCYWISQVEELYCLSRGDCFNVNELEREESYFTDSDAFLFVNDLLPLKYAGNKPYAVSYGTYTFFEGEKRIANEYINVAYTGVINEDRGIFRLLDAFELLPNKYKLNILGFGEEKEILRLRDCIATLNQKAGYTKAEFFGTKMGAEYDEFLFGNHIGVSLMDMSDEYSQNAFPSKIMAYLGHSLYVVSSRCECITRSKVANLLTFCDNDSKDIAKAILSIEIQDNYSTIDEMRELRNEFCQELSVVLNKTDLG